MNYKSKKTWTYVVDYSSKDGAKHQQEISFAYVENDKKSRDKWTFRFEFHDYVTGKIYLLDSLHDILDDAADHRHELVDSYLEEITKNGLADNPSLQVTKLPMENPKLYSVLRGCEDRMMLSQWKISVRLSVHKTGTTRISFGISKR